MHYLLNRTTLSGKRSWCLIMRWQWKMLVTLVYSENDNAIFLVDTVADLSNAHAIIAHLESFVNKQEYLICELHRE